MKKRKGEHSREFIQKKRVGTTIDLERYKASASENNRNWVDLFLGEASEA